MPPLAGLSLISGVLPVAVTLLALGSLSAALLVGSRRWGRIAAALAVVGTLVVATGYASGIEHKVGSTFPHSFYLWVVLPAFAAAVSALDWTSGWRFRIAGVTATVALTAFGVLQVNAHYSYLPTVGDAMGAPMPDQVTVRAAASTVAATDHPTRGTLVAVEIPGVVSHFRARTAYVWLPPAYGASPHRSFSVVMLLAGIPGDPSNMIRSGHAIHAADAYAARHAGVAPILVFPDHNGGFLSDTECVDGLRGNAETYLTNDVPAFVERTYGVAHQQWGVIGYSEGGTCAITLALRHPDRFANFVDIAGDSHPNAAHGPAERHLTVARLYGGRSAEYPAHDPAALMTRPLAREVTGRLIVGDDDLAPRDAARRLEAVAEANNLAITSWTGDGGHNFAFVRAVMDESLTWVADQLHTGSRSVLTT